LTTPVVRLAPNSTIIPSATPSPIKTGKPTAAKSVIKIPKKESPSPKKIKEKSRLNIKSTSSSPFKRSTERIVQNENKGNIPEPFHADRFIKREAEKRNIDQVIGVDHSSTTKRLHNSSRPTTLDRKDACVTSKSLYGFMRVLPGEICDNPSMHQNQPQAAKTPPIIEVEQGHILGRGPKSNKCQSFKSLGIEASCDGVSRQQLRILRVCPNQGGLDLECCSNAKNKFGIVPYQVDSSLSQKKQLQLHGSNEINGVQYVIPGKTARIHVNDWVIFDLYRRVPSQVFRLVWLRDEGHTLITLEVNEKIEAISTLDSSENDADLEATQDMFSFNSTVNYVNSNSAVSTNKPIQAVASDRGESVNEKHDFERSNTANPVCSSLITGHDVDLRERQETERIDVSDINHSYGTLAVVVKEIDSEKDKDDKAASISTISSESMIIDCALYDINEAASVPLCSELLKTHLAASDPSVAKSNDNFEEGDDLVLASTCSISPPQLDPTGVSSSLERDCAQCSVGSVEELNEEEINDTSISAACDINPPEIDSSKGSTSIISLESKEAISELHPSLSKLFWRSVNSAEPDNGVSLLSELQFLYSIVPGKVMSKQIFELLIDGPESEGYSYFDPNKSEVVYEYAVKLVENYPGISLGPDWDAISRLYGRISKIRALDYGSHDTFCILQQVACALEYLLVLIENDLSTLKQFPKDEVRDFLRAKISFSFFMNPAGIRESLKQTVKLAMQFLILSEKATTNFNEEGEIHECCTRTALRCRKGLCKLTCLVSSLFCLYEGIDMESNDLSFLLKDAIEAELSCIQRKTTNQRRIKVSFLVYCHLAENSNLLISRLATLLRLTKELSFMVE
jgi:hypothetical protein